MSNGIVGTGQEGMFSHSWNGTALTIVTGSVASTVDLQGPKGDTGPRGPQGPAGVIYDEDGEVIVDLSEYYSKSEVDDLVENVEVDLTDYATKNYVTEQVVKVNTGGSVDLSSYATKEYVDSVGANVDGTTIIKNSDGTISTAIGGSIIDNTYRTKAPNKALNTYAITIATDHVATLNDLPFGPGSTLTFEVAFVDGTVDKITGTIKAEVFDAANVSNRYTLNITSIDAIYITTIQYSLSKKNGEFWIWFEPHWTDVSVGDRVVSRFSMSLGYASGLQYIPINPMFIPVDGETIIIQDGKLVCVGAEGIASSEEVEY